MKKVSLTKLEAAEIEVLQNELQAYSKIEELGINHWGTDDFLNAILTVDISLKMWIMLRSRLESNSIFFNLNLRISEGVVLLKCCTWQRSGRNDYEKNVTEKIKNLVAQQLMNIA